MLYYLFVKSVYECWDTTIDLVVDPFLEVYDDWMQCCPFEAIKEVECAQSGGVLVTHKSGLITRRMCEEHGYDGVIINYGDGMTLCLSLNSSGEWASCDFPVLTRQPAGHRDWDVLPR
jgi:hypothetical protein